MFILSKFNETVSVELQRLFESIYHLKNVSKGQFLFQEQETATELFLVKHGKIQVNKIMADGRELTLRLCSTGEIVGELALYSNTNKHTQNAKVIEDGVVAVIYKDELEKLLSTKPELSSEFMRWILLHYRKTNARFKDVVVHGKKGALYSTLIRLSNSYGIKTKNGIQIDHVFTNQELANFCGSSREVINRMLSDLKKNNIISMNDGKIVIQKIDILRQEIDCEYCDADICNIE